MTSILFIKLAFIGLFISSTLLLFVKNIYILSILAFFIFIVSLIIDQKKKLLSRIYLLMITGVLIITVQIFFNTSLSVSERLTQGLMAFLKIFSLSMLVFIFTSYVSINQIIKILTFLPPKIQLIFIITFSIISSIFAEAQKILLVQNSRGHNTKSLNIFKAFLPFIIPLLHKTLHRAEQISITLESRGYKDEK